MVGLPGIALICLVTRANALDILRCYLGGGLGALIGYRQFWPLEAPMIFTYAVGGWMLAVALNLLLRVSRSPKPQDESGESTVAPESAS